MHRRRARRNRLFRIGHRRQHVPVDFDLLRRIARQILVGRHHHRDRMADEVHTVRRQYVMMRHAQPRQRSAAWHRTHLRRILAGINRRDAGSFSRRLGIDRTNPRRRVRAAHNRRVVHARHLNVVDVSSRARDQPRIFAPANALANQFFNLCNGARHSRLLLPRRRGRSPHRIHDVLISRAPAQIAFNAMADLLIRRMRVAIQNLLRRHDHPRRTETALRAMLVPEGFLHPVQLPVLAPSLRW